MVSSFFHHSKQYLSTVSCRPLVVTVVLLLIIVAAIYSPSIDVSAHYDRFTDFMITANARLTSSCSDSVEEGPNSWKGGAIFARCVIEQKHKFNEQWRGIVRKSLKSSYLYATMLAGKDPRPPIPLLGFGLLNGADDALRVLVKIDYPIKHLAVSMQGGDDFTGILFEELRALFPKEFLHAYEFPFNGGAARVFNVIMLHCMKLSPKECPYIVSIANDAYFYPNHLEIAYKEMLPYVAQWEANAAANTSDYPANCMRWIQFNSSMGQPSEGTGFILSREMIQYGGLFDETAFPVYYEDNEYYTRIFKLGDYYHHPNISQRPVMWNVHTYHGSGLSEINKYESGTRRRGGTFWSQLERLIMPRLELGKFIKDKWSWPIPNPYGDPSKAPNYWRLDLARRSYVEHGYLPEHYSCEWKPPANDPTYMN